MNISKSGNYTNLCTGSAFPHFVAHMELMLLSGELNPRCVHCVTLYRNKLACEADTLGSYGYVYIAIYPAKQVKD
ncbi:TPA: type IV toxin-antitoxin system YeeU family antitoxin [Klebsiella pneumoniae]|nr:type IV toxin-antitoxin system YeeU family antitoxin [Klebsiella pneumoniae]